MWTRYGPSPAVDSMRCLQQLVLIDVCADELGHYATSPGNQDAVGDREYGLRLARSDDDSGSAPCQLSGNPQDLVLGADVHAPRGLDQDQHSGWGDQPPSEQDLLLVSSGEDPRGFLRFRSADTEPVDEPLSRLQLRT